MGEGVVVEVVVDDGLVDGGAGNLGERCEGTVGEVTPVPKVYGSGVALVGNKLGVVDVDQRKGVEVGGGQDEWGAEAEVEGPEVLEGGADVPERVSTDQRAVGETGAVEGNN